MENIIDYVNRYGQASFKKKNFNEVDSLIFSQLSYLKFDTFFKGEAKSEKPLNLFDLSHSEYVEELFKGLMDTRNNRALLFAVANSKRFGATVIDYYTNIFDEEKVVQFSAVTFFPKDELAYIAFRGTDENIISWREDFNMAFISPVPAQEAGVAYLLKVSTMITGEIRQGGHSKGGNIAVYSAMKSSDVIRNRIRDVYSHDGPGFKDSLFEDSGYLMMKDRIHKTVPQSSVVGLLLQHQEEYEVIKSNKIGLLQHDPFSWIIQNGKFIYLKKVGMNALFMNRTLNQWLANMENEKRKEFINLIFELFSATEISTVAELSEEWRSVLLTLIEAKKGLDPDTSKFLDQTLFQLMQMGAKNISSMGRKKKKQVNSEDSA